MFLFVLRLNVPVNNHVSFQSCRDGATASWVLPELSGSKVSAQGQGRYKVLATTTIAFQIPRRAGNYHTDQTGPESFTSKRFGFFFYVGTFSKVLFIIFIGK